MRGAVKGLLFLLQECVHTSAFDMPQRTLGVCGLLFVRKLEGNVLFPKWMRSFPSDSQYRHVDCCLPKGTRRAFSHCPILSSSIYPTEQVKAIAPATVWGQQVLAQRRDRPANDFEAKAVLAYLRACGLGSATYSTAYSNLDVIHTFRL